MTVTPVTDIRPKILAEMAATQGVLDMRDFVDNQTTTEEHPCGTVCCLAGWVINAHPDGAKLLAETRNSHGDVDHEAVATWILEASGERIPNFYDCGGADNRITDANERAMNWLRTGEQV